MVRLMAVLLVGAIIFTTSAQTIALTGTVTNQSGKPVSGAAVLLVGQKLSATTDAQGKYSITSVALITEPARLVPAAGNIFFNKGVIEIALIGTEPVRIELFGMNGNLLDRVVKRSAPAGEYRYNLNAHPSASTMMLVRVSTGQRTATFRHLPFIDLRGANDTPGAQTVRGDRLTKTRATVDSLKVTVSGYTTKTVPVASLNGTVNITLDTTNINLPKFSFFVTSLKGLQDLSGSQNGFGGDLRFGKTGQGAGLLGADSICQCLAERSMKGSKVKQWRAFLSVTKGPNGQRVDAIDRIGNGPWYDRLGRLVANTRADLISGNRPAGIDEDIKNDLPNEDGIPNHQPDPNQPAVDNHLTITGSDSTGRLYSDTSTCEDWTSTTTTISRPRCGLSWTRNMGGAGGGFGGMGKTAFGGGGAFPTNMENWISFWNLPGCVAGLDLSESTGAGTPGATIIGSGGGYGGFYCFALNP